MRLCHLRTPTPGALGTPDQDRIRCAEAGRGTGLRWRVAQKYYFEPDFDHAITRGTPNPLDHNAGFYGHRFFDRAAAHDSGDLAAADADDDGYGRGVGSGLRREGREDHIEQHLRGIPARALSAAVRRFIRQRTAGDNAADDGERRRRDHQTRRTPYNQIHVTAVYGAANKLGPSIGHERGLRPESTSSCSTERCRRSTTGTAAARFPVPAIFAGFDSRRHGVFLQREFCRIRQHGRPGASDQSVLRRKPGAGTWSGQV